MTPFTIELGGETLGPRCSPVRHQTPEARVQRFTHPGVVGATVFTDLPTTRVLESDLRIPRLLAFATYQLAEQALTWLQTLSARPLRGELVQHGVAANTYPRCRMIEFEVTRPIFFEQLSGGWKFEGVLRFEQFATTPTPASPP